MNFGEKFKMLRNRYGLTQRQAAEKLGLHPRMITRYENGLSYPRTREGYKKIAELFDVDVNYLLTETEDFVLNASARYGDHGRKQAQELIDGIAGLFAGGSLSEQDKDAVMKALQDIYWDSKARNVEKYAPKK